MTMEDKGDKAPINLKEFAEKKKKEQLRRIGKDPEVLMLFTWGILTERLRTAKEKGSPASFFQLGYSYCQIIALFRDYGESRVKNVIGLQEYKRVFKEIEALACGDATK
jgi:hypothetical protein